MNKDKKPSAKEKRRRIVEERQNRRLKAVVVVLLIAIAGEALYIFAKSDTFAIRKITVTGNRHVATKQIVKTSRLSLNKNIFDFSAPQVGDRIEEIPWIKDAECVRRLPLMVTIVVREREQRATLAQAGRFYLLDKEIYILQELGAAPPDFPVITDAPFVEGLLPGVKVGSPAVRNAVECVVALDASVTSDIAVVSAPTIDGLALKLKSGPVIMYGKTEMTDQKNYAIKVILDQATKEGRTWQYIDVRVPSNPVAKAAA
ncbi:MAG: FtsQ-type POTRA domain-containing protein [Actinomycetota bacterium]